MTGGDRLGKANLRLEGVAPDLTDRPSDIRKASRVGSALWLRSTISMLQGPVLALTDTFHGNPPLVCLILKLAGDVVEANISLLEVRLASICVMLFMSRFVVISDPGVGSVLLHRRRGCGQE